MSHSRYLCLFVVSNTYCVLFLFYFSSTCVPYVVSFSGLSILIAPLYSLTFISNVLYASYENILDTMYLIAISHDCIFLIGVNCFVLVQKQSLSQKM